jgi:hypothetical protein
MRYVPKTSGNISREQFSTTETSYVPEKRYFERPWGEVARFP